MPQNTSTRDCATRWKRYRKTFKFRRKKFSEVQKRLIACKQRYCCCCEVCCGEVLLSAQWELDHQLPLWKGGSNEESNLVVYSARCHAIKTQWERIQFFAYERHRKIELDDRALNFVPAHLEYRYAPPASCPLESVQVWWSTGPWVPTLDSLEAKFRVMRRFLGGDSMGT